MCGETLSGFDIGRDPIGAPETRMNESSNSVSDLKREMLRHTVATLAYRGAKSIDGAPAEFGNFKPSETSRTPVEILAHIADLLVWALLMAKGDFTWHGSSVLSWNLESARFFSALKEFDAYLASDANIEIPVEKLFQGPIADALTHVGQLTMLRRIAGAPIRGENYVKAEIVAGRVGSEQSSDRFEFD